MSEGMLTSPPIPPAGSPSALHTNKALIAWLAGLIDADFADVDPHALEPIPVAVRVTARVVTRLQQTAPISADDGSCITGTAVLGQAGAIPSDIAN
jgi:hypothetical protein